MNLLVAMILFGCIHFVKMCGYIYWIRTRRLNSILVAIPGFSRNAARGFFSPPLGDFLHRHNLLYM
jgi:hypothetical protein